MFDGMKRALRFNPEASVMLERGWTSDELLRCHAGQGVDPARVDDWTVPEFLMGLLAECCYVPLPDIVAGRVIQCAFPDVNDDCEHDVFTDVFARWDAGHLKPEEPSRGAPTPARLRSWRKRLSRGSAVSRPSMLK